MNCSVSGDAQLNAGKTLRPPKNLFATPVRSVNVGSCDLSVPQLKLFMLFGFFFTWCCCFSFFCAPKFVSIFLLCFCMSLSLIFGSCMDDSGNDVCMDSYRRAAALASLTATTFSTRFGVSVLCCFGLFLSIIHRFYSYLVCVQQILCARKLLLATKNTQFCTKHDTSKTKMFEKLRKSKISS